ncbi:MAG TPA: hypothetical protein VGR92_18805 [Steroidobacteraceae bacterium]|nr:hypothetical protein [Steroidobacteraceae bacterium]
MSTPNTIRDDITYMRQLAEQGRNAPILGGAFLTCAGVIFGVACFVQWAMTLRGVQGSLATLGLWGGATGLFALVWLVLFLQMRARGPAATGISNKSFSAAWLSAGIGYTVASIGVAIAAVMSHSPSAMLVYPPMLFGYYGTAWLVAGILVQRSWMLAAAAVAYLFVIILAFLSMQAWLLPAMGIALLLTLSIPGILLMREKAL